MNSTMLQQFAQSEDLLPTKVTFMPGCIVAYFMLGQISFRVALELAFLAGMDLEQLFV